MVATSTTIGFDLNECSPKGTPNLLDAVFIEKLLDYIREAPFDHPEWTRSDSSLFSLICGRAGKFMNSENIVDDTVNVVNYIHMNPDDAAVLGLLNGSNVFVSRSPNSWGGG